MSSKTFPIKAPTRQMLYPLSYRGTTCWRVAMLAWPRWFGSTPIRDVWWSQKSKRPTPKPVSSALI